MINLYSAITSSIIKFGEDFRKAQIPEATYVDWDEHAELATLPTGDLCGPAGIGLTEQSTSCYVAYSYGISTVDDENLFRLRQNMAALYGVLRPQTKVTIYDATGTALHYMVVKTPVTIAPISKAAIRAVQFITIMAVIDFSALS